MLVSSLNEVETEEEIKAEEAEEEKRCEDIFDFYAVFVVILTIYQPFKPFINIHQAFLVATLENFPHIAILIISKIREKSAEMRRC